MFYWSLFFLVCPTLEQMLPKFPRNLVWEFLIPFIKSSKNFPFPFSIFILYFIFNVTPEFPSFPYDFGFVYRVKNSGVLHPHSWFGPIINLLVDAKPLNLSDLSFLNMIRINVCPLPIGELFCPFIRLILPIYWILISLFVRVWSYEVWFVIDLLV